MCSKSLIFIHLSDIHFRLWSGSKYDIDEDLRNEVLLDSISVVEQLGAPDGILISGDIAFSGDREEYEFAKMWLAELSEKVGRTLAHIWCVPGNHDVDRNQISSSPLLETIHKDLRNAELSEIDRKIQEYMRDKTAKDLTYSPLTEYNRFAASFQCHVSPDEPIWYKDFPLREESILRVNGLNTALVSDHFDDKTKNVILGQFQIPKRLPGVINLALCHHPPDWWLDRESVEEKLDSRVRIELFGHKHKHRLRRIDNTIRITSGAMHPDRQDVKWEPRYNWFTLRITEEGKNSKLNIRVYPRIWSDSLHRFIADSNYAAGEAFQEETLDLELDEAAPKIVTVTESLDLAQSGAGDPKVIDTLEIKAMEKSRILTYRFFDLPHVFRLDIARDLNLLKDDDEGLQDFELFERVFQRALNEGTLSELWREVEKAHGDNKYPDNPFEGVGKEGGS